MPGLRGMSWRGSWGAVSFRPKTRSPCERPRLNRKKLTRRKIEDARAKKAPRKEVRTDFFGSERPFGSKRPECAQALRELTPHSSPLSRSKRLQIHKKFGKNVKRSRKRKTFLVFDKISQKNRRNRCICERKCFNLPHNVDPGEDLYFVLWQSRLKKPLSFMTVTRSVWRWWLTMWFL